MEILLLKNYYTALTATMFNFNALIDGENEVTESPRYSLNINGEYVQCSLFGNLYAANFLNGYIDKFCYGRETYYGGGTSPGNNPSIVWFGSGTNDPSFTDFAPTTNFKQSIIKTNKSLRRTYDPITKTYTITSLYVLTNSGSNNMVINEILIGGAYGIENRPSSANCCAFIRDVLGENSFVLEVGESVNFELTIKYTIAEPLQ